MGGAYNAKIVNFLEYLGQGTLGFYANSRLAFRHFQQPHKYSYFKSKRISSSTAWPYQSTETTLARAASHSKVTYPPCLFWLPPWENVVLE